MKRLTESLLRPTLLPASGLAASALTASALTASALTASALIALVLCGGCDLQSKPRQNQFVAQPASRSLDSPPQLNESRPEVSHRIEPTVDETPRVVRQRSVDSIEMKCAAELSRQSSYPFDFRLTSLDGRTIRKNQFGGRLLIVDIWATWCGPCVREVPHFIDLQDRFYQHGLSIVGINFEREVNDRENRRRVDSFARHIGINYPLALGNDSITDQIEGFRGYPTTLFIDGNGQVRLTVRGSRSLRELETFVRLLLEDPSIRGKSQSEVIPPAGPPTIQNNPFFVGG